MGPTGWADDWHGSSLKTFLVGLDPWSHQWWNVSRPHLTQVDTATVLSVCLSVTAQHVTWCAYTVFRKNTHSRSLSYLHEWCVDLNKNCNEYTWGRVDSNNVEIKYSMRLMMWLWRHICLAKLGVCLQRQEPRISFLRVLAGAQLRSYRVLFAGI